MDKETEGTPVDVLEQVKKIDKAVKAKLLIEKISIIKEFAREVNELREKSNAMLEELGLSPKDIKRVIDYVNELPEVKLSERDKIEIRDEMHNNISVEKTKTEKSLRDVDIEKLLTSTITTTGGTGATHWMNGSKGLVDSINNPQYYTTSGLCNTMFLANSVDANYVATIDNGRGESITVKL